jgi:signal transduction histidine kinase
MQILRAIIENACLHGGGQVVISAQTENERVAISISDEGTGIPDPELPYIFTPFMRGDQTIGREGRGMGLTMAKLLVEAHGGTIWVESEVNKGTHVFVRLPVKQSQGD